MNKNTLIAYGIAGVLLLFLIYKLLQKIGLVDTAEDTANEEAAEDLQSNPIFTNAKSWIKDHCTNYLKNPSKWSVNNFGNGAKFSAKLFNDAANLWDSKASVAAAVLTAGILHDQFDKAAGVFTQAPNKLYLIFLAAFFQQQYGRDMITFLADFLSNEQLAKINRIIQSKPNE